MRSITLISLLALLAGCAQPDKPKAEQPALRALGQPVTPEPTYSDESIGLEIRRQLDRAGAGDLVGVIVVVDSNIVTLRGTALNRTFAWQAVGLAHAIPGVKQVINQIQLTGPGTSY